MTQTVTSVDIYKNTFEVPVSKLKWRVSAYGIVIDDDKILLCPQFSDNRYDLPGGGVDLGEVPEDGVIREVKEETGLDVASPLLVEGASRFFTFTHDQEIDKSPEPEHVQSIMLYYVCELRGGELSIEGLDDYEKHFAKLAVWFPIAHLDTIEVASSNDWRTIVKQVVET